ncbi:MAG: GldG family protein [Clostridia bacterium]|nr:GldG family protein [Clostridia bacterium]
MEENKNEIFENENEIIPEVTEEEIIEIEEETEKKDWRAFKKGSYSAAITAIFLAVMLVINIFVSVLSDKVNLEFDMTSAKVSSLTKENVEFLEKIEQPVNITFCADETAYAEGMMDTYAQGSNIYGGAEYYEQTIKFVKKYAATNDKINVNFIDTQDSAFAAVTTKYPDESISYGDIIVSAGEGEAERYKKLGFTDIYEVEYNEQYASYGYTMYNVTGSNLETKLSGAIEYAITGKTVRYAVLTGHSKTDYTEDYISMLEQNNHSVSVIDSALITNISSDINVIIIAAPTTDFAPEEIKAIEKFLDNDGKLGKGLIYFADATVPLLPNLSRLLSDWGIAQKEGILFETDENNYMPEMPTAMGLFPDSESALTKNMNIFCTGANSPLSAMEPKSEDITATSIIASTDSVICAPIGTPDSFSDAGKYKKEKYSGLVESVKVIDGIEEKSYIYAFSSAEFIHSQWTQYSNFSNLDIALNVAENAGGAGEAGISFVTKTITNESFSGSVTASKANMVRIVFVFLIPVCTLALGIYIFIKRRNA